MLGRPTSTVTVRHGVALSAATVAVLVLDLVPTSDDAGPVVLLFLLLAAFSIGALAPARAWVTGLVLGIAERDAAGGGPAGVPLVAAGRRQSCVCVTTTRPTSP